MKFNLYRHRLNAQGYDAFGSYYGVDAPLYRYDSELAAGEVRAKTREQAKQKVIDDVWTRCAIRADMVEFYR